MAYIRPLWSHIVLYLTCIIFGRAWVDCRLDFGEGPARSAQIMQGNERNGGLTSISDELNPHL